MSEKQEPGLGMFTAPASLRVMVGGQEYEWKSPAATFSPAGSETLRVISGTGTFLPVTAPTPAPAPTPTVTKLLLAQAPGLTTVNGELTVDPHGTFHGSVVVLKGDLPGLSLPATLTVPSGRTQVLFTAAVPEVNVPTLLSVTATLGNSQVTGTVTLQPRIHPVPTPSPNPLFSVRSYGAKGDSVTDDRAAIQRAIDAVQPGQTVFFPSGQYLIKDTLRGNKGGISFLGAGACGLLHPNGAGLLLGNGAPITGVSVRNLAFTGKGDGILLNGPLDALISACDFTGCEHAIFGAGTTKGTRIIDCLVTDWGVVALFLTGGELVQSCSLVQTRPRGPSSHGIYIHSGASNVTVEDTLIRNSGKYAAQIYGEELGTVTRNTVLRRLTIEGGQGGIILAHSQMGAADIDGCLIEGCDISGVWGGAGIHYKNGKNVTIRANTISGMPGVGIEVGYLAPYEQNFSLGPALIENNTVHGCGQGFWAMQSHGATFDEIRVRNNDFSGNQAFDIHLEAWEGVKPYVTLSGNLGRVAGEPG